MGRFLNKGNLDFAEVRNSEYVDKSAMIEVINRTLSTERRCSCVTRCRRFGKSMAAKMLYAYYDKSCDSRSLFEDLAIAKLPSFGEHLNRYPTIYLDMTKFTTVYRNDRNIVKIIDQTIKEEVCELYPDIRMKDSYNLMDTLFEVADHTKERFIFIIDEWDAICREYENIPGAMDDFVNWLRRMFKTDETSQVFVGVYMTGILPIKKYKTESALNNFKEYSMVQPGNLAGYFGFTPDEVKSLCPKFGMDYSELALWYDGYQIGREKSMFNPDSVMMALYDGECDTFWGKTGAYDAVSKYIGMNYEGLKDDIIRMLSGERCAVDIDGFKNDPSEVNSRDDVLTILIHLGYLSYDKPDETCYIPNREVAKEIEMAVKANNWRNVSDAITKSKNLLSATIACNSDAVAQGIDAAHDENTSILSYNDENSLACVLSIAYYFARNDYVIHREYASGRGFADLVLIPRRNVDSPALIIELKYDRAVDTAIDQIKRRNYPAKVAEYTGDILLVGVTYDRQTKTHSCIIAKCVK